MLSGIKEYLIITTPHDLNGFEKVLGDGKHLGISITYKTQDKPSGIAEALLLEKNLLKMIQFVLF